MKNIEWKESGDGKYAKVTIGAVKLSCSIWYIRGKRIRYLAQASFVHGAARIGGLKKSMRDCKEEAVEIARELIMDYNSALKVEMANFDMGEVIWD